MNQNKKTLLQTMILIVIGLLIMFGVYWGYMFYIMPKLQSTLSYVGCRLIGIAVLYCIGMSLLCVIVKCLPKFKAEKQVKLSSKEWIRTIVKQSGCSVLIMVLANSIFTVALKIPNSSIGIDMSQNLIYNIIILLIFNPIAEEFVFRNIVFSRLRMFGEKEAIVLSAILFALPHLVSIGIPQGFYTLVLGLFWGKATAKTGNMWSAVILHSFSNLWGTFLPMLFRTSTVGSAIYFVIWVIIVPAIAMIMSIVERRNARKCIQ